MKIIDSFVTRECLNILIENEYNGRIFIIANLFLKNFHIDYGITKYTSGGIFSSEEDHYLSGRSRIDLNMIGEQYNYVADTYSQWLNMKSKKDDK